MLKRNPKKNALLRRPERIKWLIDHRVDWLKPLNPAIELELVKRMKADGLFARTTYVGDVRIGSLLREAAEQLRRGYNGDYSI